MGYQQYIWREEIINILNAHCNNNKKNLFQMIKLHHPLNIEFTISCVENRRTTTYFVRENSSEILTMLLIKSIQCLLNYFLLPFQLEFCKLVCAIPAFHTKLWMFALIPRIIFMPEYCYYPCVFSYVSG